MSKCYFSLRYCFIVFLLATGYHLGGQSLACNGGVNISMDTNCEVIISAKHILKGPDNNADPEDFILTIKNKDGSIPSEILVYDPVNHEYTDTLGNSGTYIKFITSGSYVVSVERLSDGVRCWGDLEIEDKLLPYTDECPCAADALTPDEDCIFSCSSVGLIMDSDSLTGIAGINPTFIDNCGNTGSISFVDILTPDTVCGGWIITRTWRSLVPDFHGTMITKDLACVQKFIFRSAGADAIIPPSKKVVVRCGIDTDPMSLRNYFSSTTYFNNPNPDTAIVRSYPSLSDTLPDNSIVLRPIGQGLGTPGSADALCKVTATYTDTPIIPHCGDIGYKFVRTWHVIDWCTNEAVEPLTQIIKVMDNEAPHFSIKDTLYVGSTNPWSCDSDIIVPAPDTMYDNCTPINQLVWIAYVEIGGVRYEANSANGYRLDGLGPGEYKVTYELTDVCNNTSMDMAILIIKDLVKPVALAKYRIKVVFSSYLGECVAKIFPHNINSGSFDACDNDLDLSIRRHGDSLFGPFIKFTDLDLDDVTPGGTPFGEVLVELRVEDDCGNYNIAWTTVVVEDKNTDVTEICGQRFIDLDCTEDVDSAIVYHTPTVTLNGCNQRDLPVDHRVRNRDIHELCNTGQVVVDYFIQGSVDTICTKVFTLGDLDTLRIDWPQADITVGCDDTDFGDVIITGGLCNRAIPTEKLSDFNVPQGLGYCKKIIREITVIDWCNYTPNVGDTTGIYRFVQSIKVIDNEKPTLTCQDLEIPATSECGASGFDMTAIGVDGGICTDALTWQAAMDTDNDGIYDLDLTVHNVNDSTVTARVDSLIAAGVHNVRWRATDACGNSEEVICTVTIIDDTVPSPQCITNVSTATMSTDGSMTIWAADFDPMSNSTDGCGSALTYSFSGDSPNVPSMSFTCDDIPDNISVIIDLMVYVWDQSGNRDFCNVKLRIDDNSDACPDSNSTASAFISGMVVTSLGERLESAGVNNSSMLTKESMEEMTDIAGQYSFSDNVMMADYEITASKSDDYLNGVSTLDALLIQRHIIGRKVFENPYHTIAADVNGDERVSALDLAIIRSLLLGRSDALPQEVSWRFVDADQVFVDPVSPWPLNESLYVSEMRSTMTDQDFIAVKLGDINGNAIANSQVISDNRNAHIIALPIENQSIKKGQIVEVALDLGIVKDLYGVQFGLQIKNGAWIKANSPALNLSSDHVHIDDNRLNISWTSLHAVDDAGSLMVSFEARSAGKLSDFISLDGGLASQLYFGNSLERGDIALEYSSVESQDLMLYQNIPNPFNSSTTIGFKIAEEGQVEFTVFDITGRQLYGHSATYRAGRHEINIDESIVDQKGVLYYQLSYDNKVATKKMLSID